MAYHHVIIYYQSTSYIKLSAFLAWIYGFINNSRNVKKSGPLTTENIKRRRKCLIKQTQREMEHSEKSVDNQKRLNLHKNQ